MAFTAIETKWLPMTNKRGARIKATRMHKWEGEKTPSITIPYSYGGDENNYILEPPRCFCQKL